MTLAKPFIKLIESHLKQGLSGKEIWKALANTCSKSTVYLWIEKIKKGQTSPIKSSGRPKSVSTPENIRKIQRYLSEKKPARLISRVIKINRETIRKIIRRDLKLKSYRMVRCSKLSDKQKSKRLSFAIWWRKNFKKLYHRRPVLFSDEKLFTIEGGRNRKNMVVYSDSRENAILNGKKIFFSKISQGNNFPIF